MARSGWPVRVVAWSVDVLCILLFVASFLILVTGGFKYQSDSIRISARTADTLILTLYVLAVSRGLLASRVRYLFSQTRTPISATASIRENAARWTERIQLLSHADARKIIFGLMVLALALRTANAWFYYGFFSGDDVEVLQMAYAELTGRSHAAWDLRNSFFPMAFVYPPMKLLQSLGVSEPRVLFFAGRMGVVLWSVAGIAIAYRIGRLLYGSPGAGIVLGALCALAGLTTRFAGSELPRPVGGTLLLASFYLLLRPRKAWLAWAAGAIIGVAVSLRFSEIVFIAPACAMLLIKKRVRDAVIVAIAGIITAALILVISDLVYWGDPFHSSAAIARYTLLEGRSSRSYQPWYEYLPILVGAIGPVALGLLTLAWWDRDRRPLIVWVLLPLVLLSFLPHKEARYLVPMIPLVMIFVAGTAWRFLLRVTSPLTGEGSWDWKRGLVFILAVPALLGHQADMMRFRRSEDAVDAARRVSQRIRSGAVAFEQSWRAGGWLYLPQDVRLVNIDTRTVEDASMVRNMAADPAIRFIGLRAKSVSKYSYSDLLREYSFESVKLGSNGGPSYVLFERSP